MAIKQFDGPCKNVSHIQLLVTNFFLMTPIGIASRWELLIATHLDQSNYLPNQKQGAVNECDLCVFIRAL
jgi:hypothetical protein